MVRRPRLSPERLSYRLGVDGDLMNLAQWVNGLFSRQVTLA